ncbi:MAG TPA: hypothetical protein VKS22_13250 [Candidatus Binataceae bacterium]|nr:hypothetical protein [Candidatus Binataceae bacterium]
MAQITVGGTASPGSAPQDSPVLIAGSDSTNVRTIATDGAGRVAVIGGQAAGAAVVANPVLTAGTDGSNVQTVGVNPQNQLKVLSEGQKTSYTAAILGFTPAATATDFAAITGSASKTVRVTKVTVTGLATAVALTDVLAIKRSAANTGGSPTAATIVAHDANDAGASATVQTYGANPTTGTLVGNLGAKKLALGVAATPVPTVEWRPGLQNERAWVLRGTAQVLALNWNNAAVPAGTSLDVEITWTEE